MPLTREGEGEERKSEIVVGIWQVTRFLFVSAPHLFIFCPFLSASPQDCLHNIITTVKCPGESSYPKRPLCQNTRFFFQSNNYSQNLK